MIERVLPLSLLCAVAGWLCLAVPTLAAEPAPVRSTGREATVEFNRDIRPILSDTCFTCHGPDKARRKADLRLDTETGAFADLGGHKALVPGKPDQSELFRRITAADATERMPPQRTGHRLGSHEIALVRRWIEQGAKWQKHWALLTPRRPALPEVNNKGWVRNPIDAFVLARLEREGLSPSPEADRTTLIRRLSLDLTGLPPTPAEVDAFLADASPNAYEKVVDRLLASPRYGERMAVRWLNAARYADTNGYQSDGERIMWRWRDWVIDAYNANMPFDQFTIEQIAGDLLPHATLEQKIATGFNRNHRGNGEGGIIPEEYAVEYVVDRVETTATVWLGLTLGCARCHDHKFDPFKQKEFYQLFAYFNNVPEHGRAIKYGNSPPMIPSPTREQLKTLVHNRIALDQREVMAHEETKRVAGQFAAWQKSDPPTDVLDLTPPASPIYFPLDGDLNDPGRRDGSAAIRGGNAVFVPGRIGKAIDLDGSSFLSAGDVGKFAYQEKFSLSAWIKPRGQNGTILSRMVDVEHGAGYALRLVRGKLHADLVVRWLDDAIHVQTEEELGPAGWHHVLMTYDGSRLAAGIRLYVDGQPQKLKILLDELNQDFANKEPFRIGAGGGATSCFSGAIDEVRVYNGVLTGEQIQLLATPETVNAILALPWTKRTFGQTVKLRAYWIANRAPAGFRELLAARDLGRRLIQETEESFPTTMVMEEMPTPRDAFVLIRGEYDKHGEKVRPGVPAALPALPEGAPANRLGLARWLVDSRNPLTARVAVNRFWQMYFGAGLVRTVEDFGSQGDWPSHPDLLDWLATEFVAPSPPTPLPRGERGERLPSPLGGEGRVRGWDVKAMQKQIVMSATYQQSSKVRRELLHRDPDNRLLARGPRFRLPAEIIRDQALAASSLLVEKIGGRSVKPYQPAGLGKDLGADPYKQGHGDDLHRRSLYTFWKRTVPPPALINFDAPGRETCIVRETRTNTPLQALNLLNDVTFVEAARVLARRVLKTAGSDDDRLTLAFRLVLARKPRPAELKLLRDSLEHHLRHYRQEPEAAAQLLHEGETPPEAVAPVAVQAAYTAVCSTLLNLDETITRE